MSARFGHEVLRQDYNEEILRSEHQCRDESIGGGNGLIDGWPCGARERHHGPEVPSPRVRSHRRGIVEQSEALGTVPFGRSYVSHPRTARRRESPGVPRSTVDRETKQLELKRARSEFQLAGREGLRQKRNPVEVARREPVRQRKQKGKQDLGEQRTGSWQRRVAGREKTQTGVGAHSESGKRQTLNKESPVTRLRLPLRRGWLRELQEMLGVFEQYLSQSQFLVDRLPELSGKVFYCLRQADPCHADAVVRAWEQIEHGPPMTVAPRCTTQFGKIIRTFC